jgi:hypothetical protein
MPVDCLLQRCHDLSELCRVTDVAGDGLIDRRAIRAMCGLGGGSCGDGILCGFLRWSGRLSAANDGG